ncbi:arsenate reductase family protein [Henriciella aquimarina]|uniref:arsenate reductase family protein n=1 Tax=Henriciella aquimarina TaxID=545261 RepID=UPI0009FC5839|nr:arsenate reductase family protein [Henriciella aquimarina]
MIVIHHNPDCGTSRNVLRLVEASGAPYTVIDYLNEGWTRPQLLGLFAVADLTPRKALRESKSPAEALGLLDDGVSDEAILDAMLDHPVLVNRPIVCSPCGVLLCRPSPRVIAILPVLPAQAVHGEKGEVLFDPAAATP